jgi:hypothetical protein
MSLAALELDRQVRADRLVQEIVARHGLPPAHSIPRHSGTTERFLIAYVPDVAGIAGTPHAVEYTFATSMLDAVEELRRVVTESPGGAGSAAYVHDLDGGME